MCRAMDCSMVTCLPPSWRRSARVATMKMRLSPMVTAAERDGEAIFNISCVTELLMVTADDIGGVKRQFRPQIDAALTGTPFDLEIIVAIACQDTGYIWAVMRKKALALDRVV